MTQFLSVYSAHLQELLLILLDLHPNDADVIFSPGVVLRELRAKGMQLKPQ